MSSISSVLQLELTILHHIPAHSVALNILVDSTSYLLPLEIMPNGCEATLRSERIQNNCNIIWGSDTTYDLDAEIGYCEKYSLKKDYGDRLGWHLTMKVLCNGINAAWEELGWMLGIWANKVQREAPMTREESLSTPSGPMGEYRRLLEKYFDSRMRRRLRVNMTHDDGTEIPDDKCGSHQVTWEEDVPLRNSNYNLFLISDLSNVKLNNIL